MTKTKITQEAVRDMLRDRLKAFNVTASRLDVEKFAGEAFNRTRSIPATADQMVSEAHRAFQRKEMHGEELAPLSDTAKVGKSALENIEALLQGRSEAPTRIPVMEPGVAPGELVVIESPYAGDIELNTAYARACMADCLDRGENPYASHLLFTQVGILDDTQPIERARGIFAGLDWGQFADKVVVYQDLGISSGMGIGIMNGMKNRITIEYRNLDPERMFAVCDAVADEKEKARRVEDALREKAINTEKRTPVRPLDFATILQHAFICGRDKDADWVDYDPTDLGNYRRIYEKLYGDDPKKPGDLTSVATRKDFLA